MYYAKKKKKKSCGCNLVVNNLPSYVQGPELNFQNKAGGENIIYNVRPNNSHALNNEISKNKGTSIKGNKYIPKMQK